MKRTYSPRLCRDCDLKYPRIKVSTTTRTVMVSLRTFYQPICFVHVQNAGTGTTTNLQDTPERSIVHALNVLSIKTWAITFAIIATTTTSLGAHSFISMKKSQQYYSHNPNAPNVEPIVQEGESDMQLSFFASLRTPHIFVFFCVFDLFLIDACCIHQRFGITWMMIQNESI